LELRTDSIVDRILVDEISSVVRGVSVVDRNGAGRTRVLGRHVMLCASTLESTRILLNSKSERHPKGLGGGSGLLGHCLMDHVAGVRVIGVKRAARGEAPSRDDALYICGFNPTPHETGCVRDYAAHCTLGWPVGPQSVATMKLPWSRVAGRHLLAVMAAYGETLPHPDNHVALSRDRVDAWGIPVLRVHYRLSENDRCMAAHQAATLCEMMTAAGYDLVRVEEDVLPGSAIHEMGTARMGDSQRTSVVDRNNECWEARNLFVTDGACFVSSGFQPPTLTIMAITARACDHVLERLRRS
jgi:choline dehydrogenase-like flavoprotein